MNWNLKIGLEIHVQLNTNSKLFSYGRNESSSIPNSNVAPLDIGCPGALPVLNEEAVKKAICAGKILNCKINNVSKFDRKHYRYSDLPLGYQITQFYKPICTNGYVNLSNDKTIGIDRIHMETDAGKLIHKDNLDYIDYNRCGCPLIEIVTFPDFTDSDQVVEFLRKLIRDLEYGNVSDCNMEKGNLRCDINISIYQKKSNEFISSERVEIKNVNSVEFIRSAIEYEYARQVDLMNKNEKYSQHTRSYVNDKTVFMRKKESASEYRYWPCGNLPSLILTDDQINHIIISETYDEKLYRYMQIINNKDIVSKILSDRQICLFFEKGIVNLENDQIVMFANLLACDLIGLCVNGIKPYDCLVTVEYMVKMVKMVKTLSSKIVRNILKECFNTGKDPDVIVNENNLKKITDENQIINFLRTAYKMDSDAFFKYKNEDVRGRQAIFGMIMKLSAGQVDVAVLDRILLNYKMKNELIE